MKNPINITLDAQAQRDLRYSLTLNMQETERHIKDLQIEIEGAKNDLDRGHLESHLPVYTQKLERLNKLYTRILLHENL